MLKRPTQNESEEEILKLQQQFLNDKKEKSFQPAASFIRNAIDEEKNVNIQLAQPNIELVEKDDLQVIVGDIIEKPIDHEQKPKPRKTKDGFPKASRIKENIKSNNPGKSLFAMSRNKTGNSPKPIQSKSAVNLEKSSNFPSKSFIVTTDESQNIHQDNIKILENMQKEEILEEKQKLIQMLDPSLIKFIQNKRQQIEQQQQQQQPSTLPKFENIIKTEFTENYNILPDTDLQKWHSNNLNVKLEKEKFEWMTNIPAETDGTSCEQPFEARFDWKGTLLPYKSKITDANRDLFLHEEDVQRPGYTLQELFRLARSSIMQHRISAIQSIGGILSIYNQGYYDKVIELPISKIFFLLRFAFDDNTPSILEASSSALSTLLYNQSDEMLLDITFECAPNNFEPNLYTNASELKGDSNTKSTTSYNTMIAGQTQDDVATLNDFYLAETDLIKCVLRSNIIQRISYILFQVKADNSTVWNCIKILIRLARTDVKTAQLILNHDLLVNKLCENFLPIRCHSQTTTKFYGKPHHLVVKLFRIIAAYGNEYCVALKQLKIDEILKAYIFNVNTIDVEIMKLHIEMFRLIQIMMHFKLVDFFDELYPALLHKLEWCYQFINNDCNNGTSIIYMYAASLIRLFGSNHNIQSSGFQIMITKLQLCFSKWFALTNKHLVNGLFENILLGTCLQFCVEFKECDFSNFYQQQLVQFIKLKYSKLTSFLSDESILLSTSEYGMQDYPSLPTLNSIVFDKNSSPKPILSEKYPIFVLNNLFLLLNHIPCDFNNIICNEHIINYLHSIEKCTKTTFHTNWFCRNEIQFLCNILQCSAVYRSIDKSVRLKVAHRLICCCAGEYEINLVLRAFNIIFDLQQYENNPMGYDEKQMNRWKQIYVIICILPHLQNSKRQNTLNMDSYKNALFSNHWLYAPLLILLNFDEYESFLKCHDVTEGDIIKSALSFISLWRLNCGSVITPTEELLCLMTSFMGPQLAFLDADVKDVLKISTLEFFAANKLTEFQFNEKFLGKIQFDTFYTSFLEQFQACSYGDETFAALLMVPLSMKYDCKWRRMVWFEHASVLRFIRCNEHQLIDSMDTYLEPLETNLDILKVYAQTLNSNGLIVNSVPFKIAAHHIKESKLKRKP